MSSLANLARFLRVRPTTSLVVGVQKNSKAWYSTVSFDGGDGDGKNGEGEESDNDLVTEKPNLQLQGVDPRRVGVSGACTRYSWKLRMVLLWKMGGTNMNDEK
ncbi:hypothetical protein CK203_021218 [Vitis vinifera]|uniref:Uncharacterized protein n=1 Tax=Vitis vinifera TaxID=29760 RepID=A0A438IMD7_VITVI|nr:hypothetical protein CK203_021218 [Vitis vinifera]